MNRSLYVFESLMFMNSISFNRRIRCLADDDDDDDTFGFSPMMPFIWSHKAYINAFEASSRYFETATRFFQLAGGGVAMLYPTNPSCSRPFIKLLKIGGNEAELRPRKA